MVTTPDPIDPNSQRVLVRNTASGFEQGIAAMAGLFTAGPLGMLCSWAAIRGLQGKWAPWFILGIPSSIALIALQFVLLGVLNDASNNQDDNQSSSAGNASYSIPLITAGQLLDQFDDDGDSASNYYDGKMIKVTGKLASTGEMPVWGTPFLIMQDPGRGSLTLRGVNCQFSKSKSSKILSLTEGRNITMIGKFEDDILGQIHLKGCSLL